MFKNAYIPYGGYYSSPFCKWMGSLANVNSIELGAATSKRWFASRDIDPAIIDYLYLGVSVGQKSIFYGAPWAAALMGAGQAPGRTSPRPARPRPPRCSTLPWPWRPAASRPPTACSPTAPLMAPTPSGRILPGRVAR